MLEKFGTNRLEKKIQNIISRGLGAILMKAKNTRMLGETWMVKARLTGSQMERKTPLGTGLEAILGLFVSM